MIFLRYIITIVLLWFACPVIICAKTIYIKNYMIDNCTDGIQCYKKLKQIHEEAYKSNFSISYQGIQELILEIPEDAQSIVLPDKVDFAGVRISICNTQKDFYLFSKTAKTQKINISPAQLAKGNFTKISELRNGHKILIIEDRVPWVEIRHGYSYGAFRKDILLLDNGKPCNNTITSYNKYSEIKCSVAKATKNIKEYKNLKLLRSKDSTFKTFIFKIENENNVRLSNISIFTPVSQLFGDVAITINNCTNVRMDSIEINGTYSQKDKYGYGISMNNVWNSEFVDLTASGKWGIFGNNNINSVVIKDSNINRFDIHCYGRDVRCYNTTFNNLYNQFSSMYGELYFEKCVFNNFVPVLLEPSYYAYTPFNVTIKDCVLNVDYKRPYLVQAYFIDTNNYKIRNELKTNYLPNIYIYGLTLQIPHNKQYYLFGIKSNYIPSISNTTKINAKNIFTDSGGGNVTILPSNKYNKIFSPNNVNIEYSNYYSSK